MSRWLNTPDGKGCPFTLEIDKGIAAQKPREMYLLFPNDATNVSNCFAMNSDGKMLIHSGFWDNSLQLTTISNGQTIYTAYEHGDVITCLDIGDDGKTIVTGSSDTSVRLWQDSGDDNKSRWNITKKKKSSSPIRLKQTLIGHDDIVTAVAVNTDLGVIVSSSKDKTVMQYSTQGKYLRTLYHKEAVDLVKISDTGSIVSYCSNLKQLYLYNINGHLETTLDEVEGLSHLLMTKDGKYLVTGDDNGYVAVRNLENLELVYKFDNSNSSIRSLAFIYEQGLERYLLAGLNDGRLMIFIFDSILWVKEQPQNN